MPGPGLRSLTFLYHNSEVRGIREYHRGCVLPADIAFGFGSSTAYLGASQVALGKEPACQCRRC